MRKRIAPLASLLAILVAFVSMAGAPPQRADARLGNFDYPNLESPPDNFEMTNFGFTLQWRIPTYLSTVTQYHLEIRPNSLDGPEINVIRNRDESFAVPAPPNWYVILPDMKYVWRVRLTDKTTFAPPGDPAWGPWSQTRFFRTPKVSSAEMTAVSPAHGSSIPSEQAVTLQWSHPNPAVFYYELQVSGDPKFDSNPATATSFVWWNLIHGGVTTPPNSWQTPPLQPGVNYYWRVRPRIQGDGTPLLWSQTFCINAGCEVAMQQPPTAPTPTPGAPVMPTPTPAPTSPVATPTPEPDGEFVEVYQGRGSIAGPTTIDSSSLRLTPGVMRYVMMVIPQIPDSRTGTYSNPKSLVCADLHEQSLGRIDGIGCVSSTHYLQPSITYEVKKDVIIRQGGDYYLRITNNSHESYFIWVYRRP